MIWENLTTPQFVKAVEQSEGVGLASFFGEYVRDWNSIMALNTLTSIPLMIIFVIFQRWVVQGMTSGAVK